MASLVQHTGLKPDINCHTNHPTNHPSIMEQSPSWKANSSSASQKKKPHILWNPNVRCNIHISTQIVPTLSHIHPLHALPTVFRPILILSSHLRLGLPGGLFPSDLPHQSLSHIHATCSAHVLFLHFDHSNNIWWAPHYVVFSTPVSPRPSQDQISSSAPHSQKSSAYVPPSVWVTKFHTHTKQKAKLQTS